MSVANRFHSSDAISVTVLALALIAGSPVMAAARFNPVCSNRTIEGIYGIQIQGTRQVPENLGGGTGTLWRTYMQLTDVESAFRSLKSELGLRPIHHQLDQRCKAQLWISILA